MKAQFEKKTYYFFSKIIDKLQPYPTMFHPHMELFYVTHGSSEVVIDGARYTLEKDELILVFPYVVHEYKRSPDVLGKLVMFSPSVCPDYEKTFLTMRPKNPRIRLSSKIIRSSISRILELMNINNSISNDVAKAYLRAVIGDLLLQLDLEKVNATDFSTTQKALQYCSAHFRENFTLKSLSKELFVSESQITRVFSTKIGTPFRDYINQLRVNAAMELLTHTNMRITDIMYECGFVNQSTFNRVFLDICGTTPKEYRVTGELHPLV